MTELTLCITKHSVCVFNPCAMHTSGCYGAPTLQMWALRLGNWNYLGHIQNLAPSFLRMNG